MIKGDTNVLNPCYQMMLLLPIFLIGWCLAIEDERLPCLNRSHCHAVSHDSSYVGCSFGECTCLVGFSGEATEQDPCYCPSPLEIHWLGGNAYCVESVEEIQTQRATRRERIIRDICSKSSWSSLLEDNRTWEVVGDMEHDGNIVRVKITVSYRGTREESTMMFVFDETKLVSAGGLSN